MIGTVELAAQLGVSHTTIHRYAAKWYGPIGSGRVRVLDEVDVKVARAWLAIEDGGRRGQHQAFVARRFSLWAETAIRSGQGGDWLLVTPEGVSLHASELDTVNAWWAAGADVAGRVIYIGEPEGRAA